MDRRIAQPDPRFNKDPAYQYILEKDELPTYTEMDPNDPIAKVRLFLPNTRFVYYATALTHYDEVAVLSGFCVSPLGPDCDEEGDMAASELIALRDPMFGLPVERDLIWTPRHLSEIRKEISNE